MATMIQQLYRTYVPKNVRTKVKQRLNEGNRAAQRFINQTVVKSPIGGLVDQLKPTMDALGLAYSKGPGKERDDILRKAIVDLSVDSLINAALLAIGGGVGSSVTKSIANKTLSVAKSKGLNAAINYFKQSVVNARNTLVKQNPKASQAIQKGTQMVKDGITKNKQSANKVLEDEYRKILGDKFDYVEGSIDDLLFATSEEVDAILGAGASKLLNKAITNKALTSAEEASFKQLIKENSDELGTLVKDLGVKSKFEIPNVINFVKQLGDIIKNSPNYIKSQATGSKFANIGNLGLSVYDLYQAYKENDNTLIPKTINNLARVGAGALIPGNTIMKLLYGGLGYVASDKLTKAAFKKLGIQNQSDMDENLQKEIEAGIAQPGLDNELPEFIQGQSGRKYHVKGNRIYAFDTGRPVNIQQALQDADAYVNFQRQQTEDRLNIVNQQIADMEKAQRYGYGVNPADLEPLYIEKEQLQGQLNSIQQLPRIDDEYDATGDLVEQYKQKEVLPQQLQENLTRMEQQQSLDQAYKVIFDKIAQDTYKDMDNYYTPENQAVDYYQYMRKFAAAEVPYMTPQEFSRYSKVQAMYKLGPTLRENAMKQLNSLIEAQKAQREYNLDVFKANETSRSNRVNEQINMYKALETGRNNRVNEQIKGYEAQTGRINSNIQGYNAQTNRMEVPIKQQQADAATTNANVNQQYLPYRQGAAMSETVMNASMSDLPLDSFLNTNQSVMSQIFPGTQQGNSTQQQVQNIRDYYNQQGQQ